MNVFCLKFRLTIIRIRFYSKAQKVDPALIAKAQKLCKFASSALNYDDVPEAINNLQKALQLLQTGK